MNFSQALNDLLQQARQNGLYTLRLRADEETLIGVWAAVPQSALAADKTASVTMKGDLGLQSEPNRIRHTIEQLLHRHAGPATSMTPESCCHPPSCQVTMEEKTALYDLLQEGNP